MSELQLGLIGIGLLVLIAIFGFNRWQERNFRRQAEQGFRRDTPDVLMDESQADELEEPFEEPRAEYPQGEPVVYERKEPVVRFDTLDEVGEQTFAEPELLPDESLTQLSGEPSSHAAAHLSYPDELTEQIYYRAGMIATDGISAKALLSAREETKNMGKPVYWYGWLTTEHRWELITSATNGIYEKIAIGIQLADRSGQITSTQLNLFYAMVEDLAARLSAVFDCDDRLQVLERAKMLDAFCVDVDVLLGINLVAATEKPFAGTKIRALAESAGMHLAVDGSYHYRDDEGINHFSLQNLDETSPFTAESMKSMNCFGLTLLFDVPRVPKGLRRFEQMIALAQQMAEALHARVVDDNRRPLTSVELDKIRGQLREIYARMDAQGIPSGSLTALRLFG